MNERAIAQQQNSATPTGASAHGGILQRKCACGQHTPAGGECAECRRKREATLQHAARGPLPDSAMLLEPPGPAVTASNFGQDLSQVPVRHHPTAVIQTKLIVGLPGDAYEREADRVADAVLDVPSPAGARAMPVLGSTPSTQVQRQGETGGTARQQPTPEEREEEKKRQSRTRTIQAKEMMGGLSQVTPQLESSIHARKGSGKPLPASAQAFFEPRFGRDFSSVRTHTDGASASLNQALNARAFTVGRDIFFGRGQYNPDSPTGQKLLAHELTHVVQQGDARIQPQLATGSPNDRYEQEAERVSQAVTGQNPRATHQARESNLPLPANVQQAANAQLIQRVPAVPSFGTHGYCGFGITTRVPGFVQSHFTGSYNVDYTTGCNWIWWHAWSSLWELYDSADRKLDTDRESPFGDYDIQSSDVTSGTPGDGSAKWSLWYRITHNQPWNTDDPDAYPYDYVLFDVYAQPLANPATRLTTERGPVVWEDSFTPAEDGASINYSFSTTESRTTTDSQTATVSTTIGGERSSNVGFEYEGLTGGFANRLSYSMTQSISRTHSVSVSTSQTLAKTFNQPNLRGGVRYSIKMRPLYHLIDGSVDLINHRDGVITSGATPISGGIRVLKGIDISIESDAESSATARGRWSCDARCNVEGTEPQCTGRVTGHSSGHSSEEQACREAKRDATQKAPQGCYARHCRCFNCTNR